MAKVCNGFVSLDVCTSKDSITLSIASPRLNADITTITMETNDFDSMMEELTKELRLILEDQE